MKQKNFAALMTVILAAAVLVLLLAFSPSERIHADAVHASASCSLGAVEGTIECDSTTQIATRTNPNGGWIVNGGTVAIWVNFGGNTIAGTNAQNVTGEIEMPAGATVYVRRTCRTFAYKAASSTSVLYWFPEEIP